MLHSNTSSLLLALFFSPKKTPLSHLRAPTSRVEFLVSGKVPYVVTLPCGSAWTIITTGLIEVVAIAERIGGVDWSPEALRCAAAIWFGKSSHVVVGVESLVFWRLQVSDTHMEKR